jgi:hypothetical protein
MEPMTEPTARRAGGPSSTAPSGGPPAPGYWMAADGSWHPPQTSPVAQTPPASPGNGLATAALVLGIIGICLFWLTGVGVLLGLLAVIFGAVGVSTARRHEGRPNERRAWAGIITGVTAVVLSIVAIVALMVLADSVDDTFMRTWEDLDSTGTGINTDRSDGVCDERRFMQDPDC